MTEPEPLPPYGIEGDIAKLQSQVKLLMSCVQLLMEAEAWRVKQKNGMKAS